MTTSSLFGNNIKSTNIISMILLQKNYEHTKNKEKRKGPSISRLQYFRIHKSRQAKIIFYTESQIDWDLRLYFGSVYIESQIRDQKIEIIDLTIFFKKLKSFLKE